MMSLISMLRSSLTLYSGTALAKVYTLV